MPKLRTSISMKDAADNLSKTLSKWLEETDPTDLWQSCASCLHLSEDRNCSKFGGKQPPVSVVVKGCSKYEDNFEIPF